MGYFVSIVERSDTAADVFGQFTGGASTYAYSRRLKIDLYIGSSYDDTVYVISQESSGPDSTFIGTINGLTPSTTYSYTATLQYWSGTWVDHPSYVTSGSFTTDDPTIYYYATLTFDSNGGTPTYSDVSGANTVPAVTLTMRPAPTKSGYFFDGWVCTEDGEIYKASSSYTFRATTGGTTYHMTAQWSMWKKYTPTIFNVSWKNYKPTIWNGSDWVDYDSEIEQ